MTPRRMRPEEDFGPLLALIQTCFAYMEGRIDPPSSMHRLTTAALSQQARDGEVWVIDAAGAPVAGVVLSPRDTALYLGKLAVAPDRRGQGLARALVDLAATRAQAQNKPVLELQTRVELTENHATFARMGFVKTGETAHPGYGRPTSITMHKKLTAP